MNVTPTLVLKGVYFDDLYDGIFRYRDAMPAKDWTEMEGNVLWWKFPVTEPPHVGSPLDDDWPGYHTHWTRIFIPKEPKE